MRQSFSLALRGLLNEYGWDNKLNTPDYVLSSFLYECLTAYGAAVKTVAEKHPVTVMPPLGKPPWEQRGISRELWQLEGRVIELERKLNTQEEAV